MGGVLLLLVFDIHADVVQERAVAHRIDRVDVTPPHLFVAAVASARFIMLADYVTN